MATWYVRTGGSNNNGGSSASTSPDQSGTDGTINNGSTAFSSASANFVAGDVGKGLNIAGTVYRVAARVSATAVTLERNFAAANTTTASWKLGGAVADLTPLVGVAAAVVQAGDTIYIGSGSYRALVTFSMTTPASTVTIQGDIDGTHTGDVPGSVILTAFLTNDKTAPSATSLITMSGCDNITFLNLVFVGGSSSTAACVNATSATSTGIVFRDCMFFTPRATNQYLVSATNAFNVAFNWTIDRCFFIAPNASAGNGAALKFTLTTGTGADYDANVQITNCVCIGTFAFVTSNLTNANFGGGVDIKNCTVAGVSTLVTSGTRISTSIPCTCNNSLHFSGSVAPAIGAGASGQITEDYNLIVGGASPLTLVSAGAHSISDGSYAPLVQIGQELQRGARQRRLFEPTTGSPVLGFGGDGSQTAYDADNRLRPAGGASASPAAGARERGNTWAKETGTTHTGTNAISVTGPGYQDFDIAVDNVSTIITVYMRYDSTYAGTRPQFAVLNGGECGVADQTITATTAALNAWEQQSITVSPSAKGIVTVRVISNDTNGGGKAFADTFAVT